MPSSQKPFKTLRQQLTILRNRNLLITDGSKAMRILEKEGYYNIINGYKDIFLDDSATITTGDDRYKSGTTFDHIYALYDFDRNLRWILIKYILKMETSIKTKIAYIFSETYRQNFSYLDINNFDSSNPQKTTKLIAAISNVIKNNSERTRGGQIYHYLNKYKELPLWVLIKKMTLGETYHFFDALQTSMKADVVKNCIKEYERTYSICLSPQIQNTTAVLTNVFRFINQFRNICAHEERLFNTVVKDRYNHIPHIIHFHKARPYPFKSRLFDCVLILGFFLSKKDYGKCIRQLSDELEHLQNHLPPSLFNIVLIQMGFSRDWMSKTELP